MIGDTQVSKLLEEFSSSSPVPGGGSASALVGALAASLGIMVCQLTIGRKKYGEVQEEVEGLLRELKGLREELLRLADEDLAAYAEMAEALKMPRDTDEERENREAALREAAWVASNVPRRTMICSLRVMELAGRLCEIGNRNAISDSGCALSLANSALWGGHLNVLINLPYLEEGDEKADLIDSAKKDLIRSTEVFKTATTHIGTRL